MQELHLEERPIEMILNGQKLDDRVIHASQSLMKRMFPKQTGLRDTVVLEGAEDGMTKHMDSFRQCLTTHVCTGFVCPTNLVRMAWWRFLTQLHPGCNGFLLVFRGQLQSL